MTKKRIAYIFPGQGAQYPGMGKDFAEAYQEVRDVIEHAEDILKRKLGPMIFDGPESTLTETHNSQVAIYLISIAYLKVIERMFPNIRPTVCSGLSLGEYTALTATGAFTFEDCLPLVQSRGSYMSDACNNTRGTMAVILGMDAPAVEEMVEKLGLPNDLWVANLNCPGQVVISGTIKGIEKGAEAAKKNGAKRVLPLQVHGAFHSGLMLSAQQRLEPFIEATPLQATSASLVMNVPGAFVTQEKEIKQNLVDQVTHPVRWEKGIRAIENSGIDLFVEIGCGKTLAGMNKRIGVTAPTLSIEKVEDLEQLATVGE